MSKEVKVGILVLVSGVLMYFGYHFLKGNDLLSNESVYQIRYAKIDGLQVSSSVLVNGHRIGQVEDIETPQRSKNTSLKNAVEKCIKATKEGNSNTICKDDCPPTSIT